MAGCAGADQVRPTPLTRWEVESKAHQAVAALTKPLYPLVGETFTNIMVADGYFLRGFQNRLAIYWPRPYRS